MRVRTQKHDLFAEEEKVIFYKNIEGKALKGMKIVEKLRNEIEVMKAENRVQPLQNCQFLIFFPKFQNICSLM